ncbi:MAG: HEAT repeat domain-containing protein [Planctomycetota bacterium]
MRVWMLLVLAGLVAAGPGRGRLSVLVRELQSIEADRIRMYARRSERMALFQRMADLGTEEAAGHLARVARDARHNDVQADLLKMIVRRFPNSLAVTNLMRMDHLGVDSPHRDMARKYLVAWHVRRRDEEALIHFCKKGTLEDQFLGVQALGKLGSLRALELASDLLEDPSWNAVADTPFRCGTLARAARRFEGARAARFLILLRRDPRFTQADEADLVAATRLWRKPWLLRYVRMEDLANSDPAERVEMANFFGRAGVESSRAPLVRLVRRHDEPEVVRSAALVALGSLRIARGDLVRVIEPFLKSESGALRHAAIRALSRLRVRQSVKALVSLLDGDDGLLVRKELSTVESRAPEFDWADWLEDPEFPLPDGT